MLESLSRIQLWDPMDCSLPGSPVHGISQEYWSGLPFPSPVCLPDPGIKPTSLVSPVLAGGFFTSELPGSSFSSTLLPLLSFSLVAGFSHAYKYTGFMVLLFQTAVYPGPLFSPFFYLLFISLLIYFTSTHIVIIIWNKCKGEACKLSVNLL